MKSDFGVLDFAVFVGCLGVFAGIGVFVACRGQRTANEVLLGNRQFSIVPMALTVMASFLSAISLLGFPVEIYTHGTMMLVYAVMYCLAFPVSAYIFLPTLYNLKLTSAYQYLELRYSAVVRRICCCIFITQVLLYMAVVLYAPSLALSQVTPLSMYTSIFITGLLAAFYTSIGGAKAVVYTSAVQMCLIVFGLTVVVISGLIRIGGVVAMFERSAQGHRIQFDDFRVDPTVRHSWWSLMLGGCFMMWSLFSANQMTVQRYISMPTLHSAQTILLLNIPFNIIAILLYTFVGLLVYATYAHCDPKTAGFITKPDQLVPFYVMDKLSDIYGLPGLFVSAIYSAGLSTLSGGMNALSAVIFEDILQPLHVFCYRSRFDATQGALVTRVVSLAVGITILLLALLLSLVKSTILQLSMTIFGIFGGPVLGAFSAGMLMPCANKWGALVALIASCATNMYIGFGAVAYGVRAIPLNHHVPTNVTECTSSFALVPLNVSFNEMFNRVSSDTSDLMNVVQISYQYYTFLGVVVFWIVCFGVSVLTNLVHKMPYPPENLLFRWRYVTNEPTMDELNGKGEEQEKFDVDQEFDAVNGKLDKKGKLHEEEAYIA